MSPDMDPDMDDESTRENGPADLAQPRPRRATCPICGAPTETAFRPFCFRRCADVDLHRWLSEAYRVPATESDEEGSDLDEKTFPDPI